ncbi:MAG: radical SAM protein [Bacteroidota bacterium]
MYDSYNRHINYLRISVTDRCNLRCTYCMPAGGIELMHHSDILSFEEIMEVVDAAISMGVDKIRITGGEPLVRKGIVNLVEMIAAKPGIRDLGLTTNGQLLGQFAQALKDAGLHRVNVSLDTMDPEKYRQITRGGEISKVLDGIETSVKTGLSPVKINCVITKSPDEPGAIEVAAYGKKLGLQVRYIRQMDLEKGEFYIVDGGSGGDCSTCNRLRLTANGMIKPCLFNDMEYHVREHGAAKALQLALGNKPSCGTVNKHGEFYNIGG